MRGKLDFGVANRIFESVKYDQYEIVHTHTPRSALIGRSLAKKLGVPLVHHVHSPTQRDTENPLRNWVNAMIEDKLILPSADHLIPVSLSLKTYLLAHGVDERKITPVFNGVPIVKERANWQAPQSTWIIGTVALFRPRKGLEVLLHSLRQLIDLGLDVKLKAVGTFETPEYQQTILSLVTDLTLHDYIEWTGFTSHVHEEMTSMHLFVLPSLFGEGLPMVVIEAMSVGIPVVSTNVEGIPDVLEQGKSGIVVEANNVNALTKGIQSYINGDQNPAEIAERALERQARYYSSIAMTEGLVNIYNQLLNRKR
jgi:glycosyltransferase involved in cell wall biosynthesis